VGLESLGESCRIGNGASLFHARPGAARASGIAPEGLEFSSFADHDFVG
jgi:hypothetical protein